MNYFHARTFARVLIGYIVLCQAVKAVTPPPDGGYPNQNTAEGEEALLNVTDGDSHTAVGFHAIHSVRGDYSLTAVGSLALSNMNSIWPVNTAVGFQALLGTVTENADIAIGYNALMSNDGWFFNNAVGANALSASTDGAGNLAIGSGAARYGNVGEAWVFGADAMGSSTAGGFNAAIGRAALFSGTGIFNMALGAYSLGGLIDDSGNNIAIGYKAGRRLIENADYNIEIGNLGVEGDTKTIRIGDATRHRATYIAGIVGVMRPHTAAVLVGADGRLGTRTSSLRYKDAVKPIADASEAIFSLKPVSFQYKKQFDPKRARQFGLVAEQVKKVAPELVARDIEGRPESVRYQAVNVMLLNEFLKNHDASTQQDEAILEQEQNLDQLTANVERLEAQVGRSEAELRYLAEHND